MSCTQIKSDFGKPDGFPPINIPDKNPLTPEGIALGRKLFYDPILSQNNDIACSSCHQQSKAFTDGLSLSSGGTTGNPLVRNTPPIFNLAWSKSFFWDGGAHDLESQAYSPIMHPNEMGIDLMELTVKLNHHPDYKNYFKTAFSCDTIYSAHVVRALAQFERTIISSRSKYDQFLMGEAFLTPLENKGLGLFGEKKCNLCHTPPLFTDHNFHNNGLDTFFPVTDDRVFFGSGRITQKENDIGKYKTPTLRNIAITKPYMHDGRFNNLYQVLNHYDHGMVYSRSIDSIFMGKKRIGITLEEEEKFALAAFLLTLTDFELLTNPVYSDPNK